MMIILRPILIFLGIALCPSVAIADCSLCERLHADLSRSKAELEKHQSYLGKNRLFLANLSAKEASKFLKVSGNVTVILTQIDRIKAQIAKLDDKVAEEGCTQCKKESP
jgi:hypothetical protein